MLKRLFYGFFLLLFLPVISYAQSTSIINGLNWLKTIQATDGKWTGPQSSSTDFYATAAVSATINIDPDTLNKGSKGNWVTAYIELPQGYDPSAIDISSIRLQGAVPAETRPTAIGDRDGDGIPDLMVKFSRSEVIHVLPEGNNVQVHVTGKVGATSFEGVDIIRVIAR
jgi:hypothetical protein